MTYSTALAKHLSIVWLLLLLGCQYEPDGEFFKDIDDSRVSRPSIQLKDALGVIPLNEKTSFSYDIVTSRAHFRTEVFFDGKTIDYTDKDYGDGYFILDPKDYEEGQYVLRIVTAVGSGTGSLADKVDAEYIQSERTWEVIIERPEPVNIKTVYIDSGSIRLEWEAYQPLKIEKFLFYEIVDYYEGYGRSEVIMKIEDPTVTSAYDSAFILGERNYRIRVVTEHHSIYGKTYEYSLTEDIGLRTHLEGDSLKVRWNQPMLYNNVSGYKVSINQNFTTTATTANRRNVSFYFPDGMLFGEKINVWLTASNHHRAQFVARKDTLIGKEVELGDELFFSPYTDSYYRSYYNKYNFEDILDNNLDASFIEQDKQTHASRYGSYCVSPNGENVFSFDVLKLNSYAFKSGAYEVTELNPVNLEEVGVYNKQELSELNSTIGSVSASNDYTLAVTSSYDGSLVYNMKDTTQIISFASSIRVTLSPDGNFLLAADTLYRREEGEYVSVSILDSIRFAHVRFDNRQPHRLIVAKASTISSYDCQTLAFVNSISLPEEVDYFSIDPHTGLVGGRKRSDVNYYIANLEKSKIDAIKVVPAYSNVYFLLNGSLFSKEGFHLKLTE